MKFLYIILAILILLLMITIHEFGHYIAGKILKFKIDEFSIGFGPALFSKKKKNGEIFSIRLLPLGGYCAFAGETEEENILATEKVKKKKGEVTVETVSDEQDKTAQASDVQNGTASGTSSDVQNGAAAQATDGQNGTATETSPSVRNGAEQGVLFSESEQTSDGVKAEEQKIDNAKTSELKKFNEQPPWKRIIVLMAGGVFNLLSAVLFTIIFIAAAGGSSPHVSAVYDSVKPGYECALQKDDEIVKINGKKVDFYHTLDKALSDIKEGDTLEITVLRGGNEVTVRTRVREYDPYETPPEDGVYPIGMGVGLYYERASFGEALKYCVPYTAELSWQVLKTFGQLIVGKVPLNQVSGPIGTVNQIADLGMQSWGYLLLLLPLIAANLGLFNLFPIPALDGSKVVFTIVEWIRGKPINQKVEGMIHFVGLIVLLGFVVILDIVNFVLGLVK